MKITKTFDTTGKKLLGIGMTAALVLSMSATAFAMSDSIQEAWSNPDLPERVVIVSGDDVSTGEGNIHLVTEDEYAAIERGEIDLADGVARFWSNPDLEESVSISGVDNTDVAE